MHVWTANLDITWIANMQKDFLEHCGIEIEFGCRELGKTGGRCGPNEQFLVCLFYREIVDASRGRTFHCKMANNNLITVFGLA